MSTQELKMLNKYKRNVWKQYPNAFLVKTGKGYCTIVQEQEDLSLKDILAEYYFNPVRSEMKAWELAQLSAKTNQNLDRTHPVRIEGFDSEDKRIRAEYRRARAEASNESFE